MKNWQKGLITGIILDLLFFIVLLLPAFGLSLIWHGTINPESGLWSDAIVATISIPTNIIILLLVLIVPTIIGIILDRRLR
jgi:hypothetical protein